MDASDGLVIEKSVWRGGAGMDAGSWRYMAVRGLGPGAAEADGSEGDP